VVVFIPCFPIYWQEHSSFVFFCLLIRLGNDLPKQVLGNWRGGEKIRIHFGPLLDLSEFLGKRDHVRTYKEISDFVMSKIAELGDEDRQMQAKEGRAGASPPSQP